MSVWDLFQEFFIFLNVPFRCVCGAFKSNTTFFLGMAL